MIETFCREIPHLGARVALVIPCSVHENAIAQNKAQAIAKTLGKEITALFDTQKDTRPLSDKTILEYHRFISTVLAQAEKEMIVLFNAASKATPPTYTPKEAETFQPEKIKQIRDNLEKGPIKWKTLAHLLLITGCRRGEIAVLKWNYIYWDEN